MRVSNNSLRQLTCAIFQQAYVDAKTINQKNTKENETKRLQGILNFANDKKNYWWQCLEEFCLSVDQEKLREEIIKKTQETLSKL